MAPSGRANRLRSGSKMRRSSVGTGSPARGRAVRLMVRFQCSRCARYCVSCSTWEASSAGRHSSIPLESQHPGTRHSPGGETDPADKCRQNRDGGRRDSWNPQGMAERVGPHLSQPLNDLPRQSGNAVELKIHWNAASFVPVRALDLPFLSAKIAGVFDRDFDAGEINLLSLGSVSKIDAVLSVDGGAFRVVSTVGSPGRARLTTTAATSGRASIRFRSKRPRLAWNASHRSSSIIRLHGLEASTADQRCRCAAGADTPRAT